MLGILKGQTLRRGALSLLISLHLTMIFVGNLPASPFFHAVYRYMGWYIEATYQYQSWDMYKKPDHYNADYKLFAEFPDGHSEAIWGKSKEMDPRRAYFLEALANESKLVSYIDVFFHTLYQGYPQTGRPSSIHLRKEVIPVADVGGLPIAPGDPVISEYLRKW